MSAQIIYDYSYNFKLLGFEKKQIHAFDFQKYRKVHQYLLDSKKFEDNDFESPEYDEELLLQYLDPKYRKRLNSKLSIVGALEIPIWFLLVPKRFLINGILVPMKRAACGSVLAAKRALDTGKAINLGGGYHHACFSKGHGFCLIPDVSIIVEELRKIGVQKVCILDLDAHQGDGHERCKKDDDVFIADMYMNHGFPYNEFEARKNIDAGFAIENPITDDEYLDVLNSKIFPAIKKFGPEIIIYCAGTDIYTLDPLTYLQVSSAGIRQREKSVFDFAKENGIPIVQLLSGGYHPHSSRIISQTIEDNFVN